MLANFFGKSKPVNFILIIVLFLLYYLMSAFVPINEQIDLTKFLNVFIVFPLFLVLFFMYNFLLSKNRLTEDNSYAFLLFTIGIGCLPEVILDYKTIGVYILLFLFLRRAYSLRTLKSVYQKLFDSGFWIGVLLLLSPYYIVYVALLYISVLLFLKITLRNILIPILGILTPLFLYFTYLFWNDDIVTFYNLFAFNLGTDFSYYNTDFYIIIFAVFGVFTVGSMVLKSGSIFSVSNKFKRIWVLLIAHLVIAIVFISLVEVKNGTELVSVLIPVTFIIANWLQSVKKNWLTNIVLILFLVLSFAIHFIA